MTDAKMTMIKNKLLARLLAVCATVLALGCDRNGNPVEEFGLDKLNKGVSTEADVRGVMGQPDNVREESDGWGVPPSGIRGDACEDVAMPGHLHIRGTHFDQFVFEHLQEYALPWRAGESSARLVRLRIDLHVTQEPREQGVVHAGTLHAMTLSVNCRSWETNHLCSNERLPSILKQRDLMFGTTYRGLPADFGCRPRPKRMATYSRELSR